MGVHAGEITLFPYQRAAFSELMSSARVFFAGRWRDLPVAPRFNTLISGETGLGKTAIVRALARALDVPLYEISVGSWILIGTSGRGGPPTWPCIFQFLTQESRGVIFVDEVDKVYGASEWTNYLRTELYNLLDRKLPNDLILAEDLGSDIRIADPKIRQLAEERLRGGMFLVAAGAFQQFWEQRQSPAIGFRAESAPQQDWRPDLGSLSAYLPRELANRFRGRTVFLGPMRFGDYLSMLHHVARKLPCDLVDQFLELGYESIFQAIDSRLGARWIEELLAQTLSLQHASQTAEVIEW